jgi:hypothetical protein
LDITSVKLNRNKMKIYMEGKTDVGKERMTSRRIPHSWARSG